MKPAFATLVFVIACLFVAQESQAQLFARPVPVGINWDSNCAVQAALNFQTCRVNGGNTWRCLVNAGFDYWQCSGSTFEVANNRARRVRAAVLGARVVRRGR